MIKNYMHRKNVITEAEKERTDVIVKVGNKWRIKGKKQKYWDAEYDTKADAQAALRAYWANKGESRRNLLGLRNAKLERKSVKEMAGNIETKSRDGVSLYLPYTSNDIELHIGGGNLGFFRVNAKITDKESLRKAVDKVIKKAAYNIQTDEKDAIENALEKHLSHMRESAIKTTEKHLPHVKESVSKRKDIKLTKSLKKSKLESVKDLRDGDSALTYSGSEINFDEMESDVFSLFGIKNASRLVLRIADESMSEDDESEIVLARGRKAPGRLLRIMSGSLRARRL